MERSPKLMLMAFVCATLVPSGRFAFASECESRLSTTIAKVTEKALGDGRVSIEDVRRWIAEETPLNPLRHSTPTTSTLSLAKFYEIHIVRALRDGSWPSVREELKQIVLARTQDLALHGRAKMETSALLAPHFAWSYPDWTPKAKWYTTRTGKTVFSISRSELEVYGLKSAAPLFRKRVEAFPRLTENEAGEPVLHELGLIDTNNQAHLRQVNLESGKETEKTLHYPNGGAQVPSNFSRNRQFKIEGDRGEMIEALSPHGRPDNIYLYRNREGWDTEAINHQPLPGVTFPTIRELANGEIAAAGISSLDGGEAGEVTYYPPFAGDPGAPVTLKASYNGVLAVEIFEFGARVIVAVHSQLDFGKCELDLFEPAVSLKPIGGIEIGAGTRFDAFSKDGRFFLVTRDDLSKIRIYEPFLDRNPIGTFSTKTGVLYGVKSDGNGQFFVLLTPGGSTLGLDAYAIFAGEGLP